MPGGNLFATGPDLATIAESLEASGALWGALEPDPEMTSAADPMSSTSGHLD